MGFHLIKVAVYDLPELGFGLMKSAEGFVDSLVRTWCFTDSSISSTFDHSVASDFSPLCVSTSLLSEFSLWQGNSGFVMRGV